MQRGVSIHIGLNMVDPAAYGGWNGQLAGCINDARALQRVAEARGFAPTLLLDDHATALGVVQAVAEAARVMQAGDLMLLTYSGHGGQVPDVNGDEQDAQDETWVLYDRMLLDDELYQLWSQFRAGVRILVLSDSCHSGTVAQDPVYRHLAALSAPADSLGAGDLPVFRAIPAAVQDAAYQHHSALYDTAQWTAGRADRAEIHASVILISGCQDNQLAADGREHGLFTETLLQVWNNALFEGTHYQLWKEIVQRMPGTQSPNYSTAGRADTDFEKQKPFTVAGNAATVLTPSVRGPSTRSRDDGPPSFDVEVGVGRSYVFEITSRPELFDRIIHGAQRSAANFYGSWSEGPHLSTAPYHLPAPVWDRLKTAERLYYRVGSTSSATGYTDYRVSIPDDQGLQAPWVHVVEPGGQAVLPLSAVPRVRGPVRWMRAAEPPEFEIEMRIGRFYVFEITSRPELFDATRYGGERTAANFYGSWSDSAHFASPRYSLPRTVWSRLRDFDALYYRVGTTTSPAGYSDYAVSTPDDRGEQAPVVRVIAQTQPPVGTSAHARTTSRIERYI